MHGWKQTEFPVVLPYAGAEMDAVIKADLLKADVFAAAINAKYWMPGKRARLMKWFWGGGAGDYTGRPNNTATPTIWVYNQVNDDSGLGVVCTWKGRPVQLSKPTNFILGYAMQKIGISKTLAQSGTLVSKKANDLIEWNFTDVASVGAGWDVANGANYDIIVSNLVNHIWNNEAENSKSKKLWPNPNPPDNYWGSSTNRFDYNIKYGAPGFLFMKE